MESNYLRLIKYFTIVQFWDTCFYLWISIPLQVLIQLQVIIVVFNPHLFDGYNIKTDRINYNAV